MQGYLTYTTNKEEIQGTWMRQINMFVVLPYSKKISPKQQTRNRVYYPWKRFQRKCFRYLGFTGSPLVWNQSVRSVAFLETAPICRGRCKLAFVKENEASKSNRDSRFMLIFFHYWLQVNVTSLDFDRHLGFWKALFTGFAYVAI